MDLVLPASPLAVHKSEEVEIACWSAVLLTPNKEDKNTLPVLKRCSLEQKSTGREANY